LCSRIFRLHGVGMETTIRVRFWTTAEHKGGTH
jgi:hypothetical protein